MSDELKERVLQFNMLKLPGQMPMMHMGTNSLVNDLLAEVEKLRAQLDEVTADQEKVVRNWYSRGEEIHALKAQLDTVTKERDRQYDETVNQIAKVGALEQQLDALRRVLTRERVGKLMHETWTQTKLSQGFHHPGAYPPDLWSHSYAGTQVRHHRCDKCHDDLISWDDLPEAQKDINRHAFDAILALPEVQAVVEP